MKVYQVYNQQRSLFGGEAAVIDMTTRLLKENGSVSRLIMKSSRSVERSLLTKIGAFCGGIYNVKTYYEMKRLLKEDPPDVVHVHSLYPMFSPSVLVACSQAGIPVVMTVHSHILTCPNWYHLYKGRICEECVGGHEYRCLLKNCRGNILESIAYTLRSGFARTFRLFHDNVTLFIVLTDFARRKLMTAGFRKDRIVVIPNTTAISNVAADPNSGEYVACAGRLSPEKGIDTLLLAASKIAQIPIRIAGDGPLFNEMVAKAPVSIKFVGMLNSVDLSNFYSNARMVVVPSVCFEQFGIVAVEAMGHGLPVIASRLGGLPEVVDDGVTGLLFEPGNPKDLAKKIQFLWENTKLCGQMGKAGREKAIRLYSPSVYYNNLIDAYKEAIKLASN
jgi:glycosyltransferase involved in cell wall biosynthesis